MGIRTAIQWCDSTVNPTTGCDGCELWAPGRGGPCYAGHLHQSRLALSLPVLYAPRFEEVRLAPGRTAKAAGWQPLAGRMRADKPWLGVLPRMIFVGDTGDFASAAVPDDYLVGELYDVPSSRRGGRHLWLCLTKRPGRMADLPLPPLVGGSRWPDNVWVGTSVTGAASLSRLDQLKRVRARRRFASVEPLREPVDLAPWLGWLDWVVAGGESRQAGHDPRPFDLAWADDLARQCAAAGVPFFLKQLGSSPVEGGRPVRLRDGHGGDWAEWPARLRVRQVPQP